jgi:hypothetical protein
VIRAGFQVRLRHCMRHAFIILLIAVCSANAGSLFRNDHKARAYRFESDAGDVPPTLAREEIVERAIYWATSFYRDDSLEFAELAFKTQPIRFWLVTFKKGGTDETFCAVLLPDGTIVEPIQEDQT